MKKLFFVLAAGMLTFAACSEFDDSELKGRIDGLEERVGDIETELASLTKKMNNEFAALQALLNGGYVSKVTKTDEGYVLEITGADGSVKKYEVYNGADGQDGQNGADGVDGKDGVNGKDGSAPQVSVELEESTGRYVWTIDGETVKDADGNTIYATGDAGVAGENGLTPTFVIANETEEGSGIPYHGNEEKEGNQYWFVSYNDHVLSESEWDDNEWTRLNVFTGTITDTSGQLNIEFDEDTGKLTFTQGDMVKEFTVQNYHKMSVTYTMTNDEFGQTVKEYGTLRFYVGETKTVKYAIEGAGEGALITVGLQNPTDAFTLNVNEEEGTLEFTANTAGAKSKLLIEVFDGNYCYHSWIDVVANIPTVNMLVNYGGLLTEKAGTTDAITFVSDMDTTIEFEVAYNATRGNLTYTAPATYTFSSKTPSYEYTVSEPAQDAYANIAEFTFTQTSEEYVHWVSDLTYRSVVGKNAEKVESSTLTVTPYFGGVADVLVDGDYTADSQYGTSYSAGNFEEGGTYASYLPEIAEWGVYFDVELPEAAAAISFGYAHRTATSENDTELANNGNGEVGAIRLGAESGSEYVEFGYVNYAHDAIPASARTSYGVAATPRVWRSSACYAMEAGAEFSKVRFGCVRLYSGTADTNGWVEADGFADARVYPWTSLSINEIEVYILK